MKPLNAYACLLALSLLQGCSLQQDTPDALSLGTHKVTVRPNCITKQIHNRSPGKDKIYNLTCGATQITIMNEELFVNDKRYGRLEKEDAIYVDGGRVFVNSEEVEEAAPSR